MLSLVILSYTLMERAHDHHRMAQRIEVYRRDNAQLKLVTTLLVDDAIASPLLPNFACEVARLVVSRS